MRFYDIFNGDADGLCALQQLRLAEPRAATLVTGVKRDIALLGQVSPKAGDELTVLDVSLDSNRDVMVDFRVVRTGRISGVVWMDLNGNGRFDNCTVDRCLGPFGKGTDYPVAADWTGDDTTKIGTFDPASGIWQLDSNGNGIFDGCVIDRCAGPFGTTGDLPIVGRW